MLKDELLQFLSDKNIKFCELADLRKLNSMKIGGRALVLVEPFNNEQLIGVIRAAKMLDTPVVIVGGMTNTLVADGLFRGVLVRTTRIDRVDFTENKEVHAECGVSLAIIAHRASDLGIGGFSELAGIPGTLGGALYGNAGAHGRAISNTVTEVEVYDTLEDRQKTFAVDEIDYAYRDSLFKRECRYVILSARLRGFAANKADLKATMLQYAKERRQKQPISMPSLGSVFKHPAGDFAPRLIESLGLKGMRIGGAEISQVHAGFIVNKGDATASDVTELIRIIKKKVADTYGINLQEEINYLV